VYLCRTRLVTALWCLESRLYYIWVIHWLHSVSGKPVDLLLAELSAGQLCQYCFYSGWFFVFMPGVTALHRSRWHLAGRPNFTLIGSGVWVYCPKTLKISNFFNIITTRGWIPCTILTKFTGFIHVLSLHKSAKFGCFSSINDKIINNLPLWRQFQPNFWWPLAAKLLMGPKKVWGEMMAGTTCIIMQNLVEIEWCTSAWEDKVWCF